MLSSIADAGVIEIPSDIVGLATVTFNARTGTVIFQIDGDAFAVLQSGVDSYTMELPPGTVLTSVANGSIFAVYLK